jgi:hypothetical protein
MQWELCFSCAFSRARTETEVDVLACRRVVNTFVKGYRDFGVCLVSVSVRFCYSSKVQSQLDCMSLRRLVKGGGL